MDMSKVLKLPRGPGGSRAPRASARAAAGAHLAEREPARVESWPAWARALARAGLVQGGPVHQHQRHARRQRHAQALIERQHLRPPHAANQADCLAAEQRQAASPTHRSSPLPGLKSLAHPHALGTMRASAQHAPCSPDRLCERSTAESTGTAAGPGPATPAPGSIAAARRRCR